MLPPLFTSEVGTEDIGGDDGQLILWFPPYDQFPGPPRAYPETDEPSTNFCKIASDIGTAGGVAVDAMGRVYVASASGFQILRFSPPFPTAPNAGGGCGGTRRPRLAGGRHGEPRGVREPGPCRTA